MGGIARIGTKGLVPIGEYPIVALCSALVVEELVQCLFGDRHLGGLAFHQHPGFMIAVVNDDVEPLVHLPNLNRFLYGE